MELIEKDGRIRKGTPEELAKFELTMQRQGKETINQKKVIEKNNGKELSRHYKKHTLQERKSIRRYFGKRISKGLPITLKNNSPYCKAMGRTSKSLTSYYYRNAKKWMISNK